MTCRCCFPIPPITWMAALALAATATAAPMNPRRVECVHPVRLDVARTIVLPGSAQPDASVTVYAKVSGFVTALPVDIGDRVKERGPLAELLSPEMLAELPLLQARIKAAESTAVAQHAQAAAAAAGVAEPERVFAMLTDATTRAPETVSAKDLAVAEARLLQARAAEAAAGAAAEEAEAKVLVAKANLQQARDLMELTRITAPFAGVIARRYVDVGELVQAANTSTAVSPVVDLVKDDILRVAVDVPETESRFVRVGAMATIEFDAFPGVAYDATVSRVSGAIDTRTRTLRAEIDLENDGTLRPGLFGRVRLALETLSKVLSVPSEAVFVTKKQPCVLVVRDGRTERQPVEVGVDDGIHAEITSGLTDGAIVVTTGLSGARDGEAVEPVMVTSEVPAGAGS